MNTDRRLDRAVSRRPRSGSGRQNAGSVGEQEPDRVHFSARRVVTVTVVFTSEVQPSAPHDADAQRRVKPQVPCKSPRSDGCPGSKPQPLPSRFAAAGRLIHLVQQGSHFSLDCDDRLRLIQAASQGGNLTISLGKICLQRVGCRLFWPALTWRERTQSSCICWLRCGGACGGVRRIHGWAEAAQLHGEIQAADFVGDRPGGGYRWDLSYSSSGGPVFLCPERLAGPA